MKKRISYVILIAVLFLFPIPMDGGYDYCGYIVSIVYIDGSYDIASFDGLFSYSITKNGKGRYRYDYARYSGEINWTDFIESYIY